MVHADFASMKEVFERPLSKHFWVYSDKDGITTGNKESFYAKKADGHLSFDISNNKALVNADHRGFIKQISMFRGNYNTDYAPGIWVFKDYTTTGPYAYFVETGEKTYDLSKIDRPVKTSLLENIFPVSFINLDNLTLKSLVFCPVSEDGGNRPRAVVYVLMVENISDRTISGSIILPKAAASGNFVSLYEGANVYAVITPCDNCDNADEVRFSLSAGQHIWVSCVISVPGSPDANEINERGSLYWFNQTYAYYKSAAGELEIPDDGFTEEFFYRSLYQCMEFVNMDENANVTGATWGTYPTTPCIWGKDFNYGSLPLYMFEPFLYKKCILWTFKYNVRPVSNRFKGGVSHSLGISLAPVSMAGFYYGSTGDARFFLNNPSIKTKSIELLTEALESRKDPDVWLCSSAYVSDGVSSGDYHTGSNIFVWFCLQSFSRVLQEVYNEKETAEKFRKIADEMKFAIEKKCVIDGPYGKQYIEGVNADGSVPRMEHEGEESDTTLIPVYGYQPYDHVPYKNYKKFALSEHNINYNPETRGIKWGNDATMPGYMAALTNITDKHSMNSDTGFMTELKKLTDLDGSVWWWPYVPGGRYGDVCRIMGDEQNAFLGSMHVSDYPGKSAWASGVFVCIFVHEFLGIKYDAPTKTLNFKPFCPFGSYSWTHFKIGAGNFSVSFTKGEDTAEARITNENDHKIQYVLEIPCPENRAPAFLTHNGEEFSDYTENTFLKKPSIKISGFLPPFETAAYKIVYEI